MTDITLEKQPARRFDFPRLLSTLIHPRRTFGEMAAEPRSTWLTPMLLLSVTAILVVIVTGYLKTRAAMMGEVQLPPDWQYWSPDMQNNYMQAQQATQGTTFVYIIPLVGAITTLWVGWVIMAGLLHLGSTLLGGRGSMLGALNIVAWASLPFVIRDLLRVLYMFSVKLDSRQRACLPPSPHKPVAHGAFFGPWRYDARARTLDFVREGGRFPSRAKSPGWWIQVDRALHSLQTSGYVPQKTWLSSHDVADYVRALSRLGEAQA